MLGLGWSEMLVIGIVILIVVGPKDLPVMMRNIGRMMGSVRRMSNEFRREIDKAIAVDELREARKAISEPLTKTSEEISREFNTLRNGRVEPSGKLAPNEPGKESVVEEIRAQAGLPRSRTEALAQNADAGGAPATPANAVTTTAEAPKPAAPVAAPKARAKTGNAGTTKATGKSTAATKAKAPAKTAKKAAAPKKPSTETAKTVRTSARKKTAAPAPDKGATETGGEG